MSNPHSPRRAIAHVRAVEFLEARVMFSTVYYVSPTGNDLNAGNSTTAAWKTVAKVNATKFIAGDQILFQRGGQWRESLTPSVGGAIGNPIIFGAYGTASANPLFIGSDLISPASFTLVTGNTYSYTPSKTINWVFDNHTFTHSSIHATSSTDPQTNLNYVNSTTDSYYYDGTVLYINLGGPLASHTITAAVRQDAVLAQQVNNITFQNLDVTETAQDNGGYAFRVQSGGNISILNCNASLAGKHHFGVINGPNFIGQNLVASQSPPDLVYGGATAFVAFSDSTETGDSSTWTNLTYTQPNGPYSAFVSHGDPGSIANISLTNVVSSGFGSGIVIYTTGSTERVTIQGGSVDGGYVELDTDWSSISNMSIYNGTSIAVNGQHDTIENCLFTGSVGSPFAGDNGYIIDNGSNNIYRYNSFTSASNVTIAIGLRSVNSSTTVYGNIFNLAIPYWVFVANTDLKLSSYDNMMLPTATITSGDVLHHSAFSVSQWQAMGYDLNTITAANAQLDVGAGMVFPNWQPGSIYSFLRWGFDNGKWDGLGLVSSTAASDSRHILGVGSLLNNRNGSPIYTTFAGRAVANTDVLVKTTYYGDAALNGMVDGSDYSLIDFGFQSRNSATPATGWQNGDFNYDGKVDGSDYSLIDNAFNKQSGTISSVSSAGEVADPISAIAPTMNSASQSMQQTNDVSWKSYDPIWSSLPIVSDLIK